MDFPLNEEANIENTFPEIKSSVLLMRNQSKMAIF